MPLEKSKSLVQPINQLFRFMNEGEPIRIWLHDETGCFIDGKITGFDEYMNCVLDDAAEVCIIKTFLYIY